MMARSLRQTLDGGYRKQSVPYIGAIPKASCIGE